MSNLETDTLAAVEFLSRKLVEHGVTSFCPTLVTQHPDNYPIILDKIKIGPIDGGATVLGVHLEGPFISKSKKGAHQKNFIQDVPVVSIDQIDNLYKNLTNTAIITMAPELDANNVIRDISSRGIVVSMGHSSTHLEASEKAFHNGAHLITHLFNAMPIFHHRDPGLLGLLTIDSDRQIYYGIIADGTHVHYSALRLAFQANKSGMVLVSDAISAAGLDHGIHMIGPETIEIKNKRAYIAGTDTLCGSIALLDECVRNMKQMVPHSSIVDVVQCATLHPARALNIQANKGTLQFGSDADFIILNDQLDVLATFVAGNRVYVSSDCRISF